MGVDSPKQLDGIGLQFVERTQWLQVLSTRWLTSSRTNARRGILLEGMLGWLVHDPGKPYFKEPDMRHALCNAHHLRELQVVM